MTSIIIPDFALPKPEKEVSEAMELAAKAIAGVMCRQRGGGSTLAVWEYSPERKAALERVRAVLEAIRHPTEAMIQAGMNGGSVPACYGEVEAHWQAMVDAVLSESVA